MLNITVRGHDLSGVKIIQDMAEKADAQGVYGIQLAMNMTFPQWQKKSQMNPGLGKYIQNALARKHVDVNILSCYINMCHPDLKIREDVLTKFETYIKHAKYFGATMVASETGAVTPEIAYTEENFTDEAFDLMASVVERLVKVGEEHKTIVGIEAGLNHPLYSVETLRKLLARVNSDYLGIIFDATNVINAATYESQVEIVEEAFRDFGEKIVAFHLKDFNVIDGKVVPCNLGDGLMDYKKIINIIVKYKPGCIVVLEETKDDGIARGIELINESLK